MSVAGDRRGMTLVELLIVAVLGAVVLGAVFQTLAANRRALTAQGVAVQSRQSLRAGLSVLVTELREISPEDGDLVSMASDEIQIRGNRELGLVCSVQTAGADPVVRARKAGRFLRGDSVRVFYDNDPTTSEDDAWRTAHLEVVDSTGSLTCADGATAQDVRLRGVTAGSPPDSITPGSLVRAVVHRRYGGGEYDGRTYLALIEPDGTPLPVVGPLAANGGVSFRYLDSLGAAATAPTDVRRIEVTLRTASDFRTGAGEQHRDSLSTLVYTRN